MSPECHFWTVPVGKHYGDWKGLRKVTHADTKLKQMGGWRGGGGETKYLRTNFAPGSRNNVLSVVKVAPSPLLTFPIVSVRLMAGRLLSLLADRFLAQPGQWALSMTSGVTY